MNNKLIVPVARLAPLALALGSAATFAQTPAAESAQAAQAARAAQEAQLHAHAQAAAAAAAAVAATEAQAAALTAEDNIAFVRHELGQERLVKGAPYCADAVHESVQALADGNRIVRSQSTRLCRDGEGRTRQEVERNGRRSVYLRDPVAKESWVLDVERKTARKLGTVSGPGEIDSAAWRDYSERMREWAQKVREQVKNGASVPPHPPTPPAAPLPPAAPMPVLITQTDNAGKDAQGRERREVQVQVMRIDAGSGAGLPAVQAPPAVALRALHFAPRGPGSVSALGSKEMEGLKLNGERTSWTIEAGKVGNEKPIVITREVWTSPELMLTVATRDFDPRSGEVNYRLQNLKRGEPEAALMKVPADYSIVTPRQPAKPAAPATPARPGSSAPSAKG